MTRPSKACAASPGRGRARGRDPRRGRRPARPGRLRPADHGRRRRRGQGQQGHPLPALVDQGRARRGRHPAQQGDAPGAGGRHRRPARDLVAMACGHGGLCDERDRADDGRRRHRPAPRPRVRGGVPHPRARPQDRRPCAPSSSGPGRAGEITADLDLDLLTPALSAIVLHRSFVLGLPVDEETVAQVVDEIILPAATRPRTAPPTPSTDPAPSHPHQIPQEPGRPS